MGRARGWQFDLCSFEVRIPESKAAKFLQNLHALCHNLGKKVERRLVERMVSMLLWFAGSSRWLKPCLDPLYRLLKKPRAYNCLAIGEIVRSLDAEPRVGSRVTSCDACLGGQLHSVSNCLSKKLRARAFRALDFAVGRLV